VLETAGTSANPIDGNAGLTGLTFNNRLADGFQFSRGARDSIAEGNYVALTQPLPEYRITSVPINGGGSGEHSNRQNGFRSVGGGPPPR
jgi:hypothetical protein